MNIHKLVRPQHVVVVRKNCLQFAGAGGLVNLVVDGQQFPRCQLGGIVAAVGIHCEGSLSHVARHGGQLVFG